MQLTSLQKALKISSTKSQILSAQVGISTSDNQALAKNLNNRPSLDLICVIDKSGSMSGQKIELVKETLNYLLTLLNENDRLCLIEFQSYANRIIPLTRCSKKNNSSLQRNINSIKATGGTSIDAGMSLAFKAIKDRKYVNQVTSIFLLSDGLDDGAQTKVQNSLNNFKLEGSFTINTFGFGSDHDPVLMSDIAKLKDGSFYYVEKLDTVDEMFVDALGGLFSVVAQDVQLEVKVNRQNKTFADISVKKTYGWMWKYDKQRDLYTINMQQLLSGVSKEFLLDIEVPAIKAKLQDHERNTVFIEVTLKAKDVSADKKEIVKQA